MIFDIKDRVHEFSFVGTIRYDFYSYINKEVIESNEIENAKQIIDDKLLDELSIDIMNKIDDSAYLRMSYEDTDIEYSNLVFTIETDSKIQMKKKDILNTLKSIVSNIHRFTETSEDSEGNVYDIEGYFDPDSIKSTLLYAESTLSMNNLNMNKLISILESKEFKDFILDLCNDYRQGSVDLAQAINILSFRSEVANPIESNDDIVIELNNVIYSMKDKKLNGYANVIDFVAPSNDLYIIRDYLKSKLFEVEEDW